MKARCDWCGIQVEVLSDGKCLLGHPVRRANKVQAPVVHEPPPERPPGFGIDPARSRVRSSVDRAERRPKAPTLGDTPQMTRTSVATATKPAMTDGPTVLPKVADGPTQLPKVSEGPSRFPKGAAARAPKSATAGVVAPPRTVPRPATPPKTPRPADAKTMRKWVPLDPFGPSGPVEITIEEPAPEPVAALGSASPAEPARVAAASASPAPAKRGTARGAAARAAARPRRSPAAATATPAAAATATPAAAATTARTDAKPGSTLGEAFRSIDWRSGAERARDASIAALRRGSNATAATASALGRATRASAGAVGRIDVRSFLKRFGPLSPQNPAMWVAGLCIAGIALLIGLRTPGEEATTQVLGSRIVAAAELTEVPGYTLEADPATEAEVAAQQPTAKKVSAANVREGNRVLARYQAIAFGPEIRWTPQRQREWLAAYALGAQIPSASFTERPLGRRSVWSAPLGNGQVAVYFYGSEVMVLVTGQPGADGDQVVDAVLTARGV